jgi:hypothetical protein
MNYITLPPRIKAWFLLCIKEATKKGQTMNSAKDRHQVILKEFLRRWSWTYSHYTSQFCPVECVCTVSRLSDHFATYVEEDEMNGDLPEEILEKVFMIAIFSSRDPRRMDSSLYGLSKQVRRLLLDNKFCEFWIQSKVIKTKFYLNLEKDIRECNALASIIEDVIEKAPSLTYGVNTIRNESFNALKSKIAPKDNYFSKNYTNRMK